MNYREIVDYIEEIPKFTSKNPLDHTKALLKCLGDPQNQMQVIHVAGTNGKGSVCAYLDSMLRAGGYKVGLFTSPHLVKINERFKINGEMISDERFVKAFEEVQKIIKKAQEEGLDHPSYFETLFLMGMVVFKEANVDYVVLETGLGGRLDATNTVDHPLACIITSISLDHVEYLGDTIGKIAGEKAGIIKPGCSVVTVGQQPETMAIIERVCRENGADLTEADLHEAKAVKEDFAGQTLEYRGENYELALAGSYQTENAALALEALEVLGRVGYPTTVEQRKKGLKDTKWNGRLTIIHREPLFIVDGAHNPAAADMLEDSVRKYFKGRKLFFIMGVFRDKDYPYIIRKLCPYAEQIITIETPDNPRALPAQELAEEVKKCNPHVQAADSIPDAVDKIFAMAGREDVILSFGSLSFIGEITTIVKTQEEKNS